MNIAAKSIFWVVTFGTVGYGLFTFVKPDDELLKKVIIYYWFIFGVLIFVIVVTDSILWTNLYCAVLYLTGCKIITLIYHYCFVIWSEHISNNNYTIKKYWVLHLLEGFSASSSRLTNSYPLCSPHLATLLP